MSSGTSLSPELIAFIDSHIESVRQLEALLWLKARPSEEHTATEIARALYSNELATKKWLELFRAMKICTSSADLEPRYRYSPAAPEDEACIQQLADEYKVRPAKVIDVIVDRTSSKMLGLMNAFRLKKGGDDDGG